MRKRIKKLVTTEFGQTNQAPKVMTLSKEFVSFLESENHECEVFGHKKRVDQKL